MKGQRQDSLSDQMRDVLIRAMEMGCYDAHDWIARRFDGLDCPTCRAVAAHPSLRCGDHPHGRQSAPTAPNTP